MKSKKQSVTKSESSSSPTRASKALKSSKSADKLNKRDAKAHRKEKSKTQTKSKDSKSKKPDLKKKAASEDSKSDSSVLGKHGRALIKEVSCIIPGTDDIASEDDKKDSSYTETEITSSSLTLDQIQKIKQIYEVTFKDQQVKPQISDHTREQFITTLDAFFGKVNYVKGKPSYNDFQTLLLKYHKNQCTVASRRKVTAKPIRSKSPTKATKLHIKYLDPISYKIATEKDYLDPKDDAVIAYAISVGIDSALRERYLERDVKVWTEYIQTLNDSPTSVDSNEVLNTIQNRDIVPDYAVFKAISQAYDLMLKADEVACQQWFLDVILPVLRSNYFQSNLNGTDQNDLDKVALIITKLRQIENHVDEFDAFKICQILHKAGQYANFIRKKLSNDKFSPQFWRQVIHLFFKFDKGDPVVELILNNKDSLFTDALVAFKASKKLSQDFYKGLTPFQPLSAQDLQLFYESTINEQFFQLTALLKPLVKHSFTTFIQQTSPYQRLTNPQQIETMKKVLAIKPLEMWSACQQQILSSIGDMDDKVALDTIKETFGKVAAFNEWKPIYEDYRKTLEEKWTIVMKMLSDKQIIGKDWQKEVVFNILDLIYNRGQKFIVVQLETGHGKSIICQELATMLHYLSKEYSIIACANEFLAHYSEFAYSKEEQQDYLSYISLNRLLQTDVTDQFLITDEHDIMAGLYSFHLIESNDEKVTAKYTPSIFAKAKGLIAFSGTISSTTKQQLNWMQPKAVFVEIPSLKNESQKNVVKNYYHTETSSQTFTMINEVMQSETEFANFIVIFENPKVLFDYQVKHDKLLSDKKVYVFDDFRNSDNFPAYQKTLRELSTSEFVVLTVKDGCRGVDFKGRSPAHVIVACDIDNYAGIVQALGRGSRDLKNISTGTLITKKKYDQAKDVIELLLNEDQRKGKAAMLNHFVGTILHDKIEDWPTNMTDDEYVKFKTQRSKAYDKLQKEQSKGALELIMFKTHCKRGLNFEGDEMILWKFIKKKYDQTNLMPDNPLNLNQIQVKRLIDKL